MPSQQTIYQSPFADLYAMMPATSPYTGQDVNVVYVKPSTEITYIILVTFNGDCTSEGSTTKVAPLPLPVIIALKML